jgi:hypothetical protein
MVIICGRGFDKAYCAPGCAGFITQFLSAWIASLVYEHHLNDNTFAEREKFLQLWKFSLFDLYYFTRNEPKNYQKRIAHIVTKLAIRPYYGYFEKAARNKEITPQIIEKHGIALALQWVLSWREESKVKQEAIKDKNNISEADRAVQDGMTNLSMSLGERRFFRPLP